MALGFFFVFVCFSGTLRTNLAVDHFSLMHVPRVGTVLSPTSVKMYTHVCHLLGVPGQSVSRPESEHSWCRGSHYLLMTARAAPASFSLTRRTPILKHQAWVATSGGLPVCRLQALMPRMLCAFSPSCFRTFLCISNQCDGPVGSHVSSYRSSCAPGVS